MLKLSTDYIKTNYTYIYKHKTKGTYAVVLSLHDELYNKYTKTNLKTIKEAQDFIAEERLKLK